MVVVTGISPGEEQLESLISRYEYQGISVYCIDKNHALPGNFNDSYYQDSLLDTHRNLLAELKPDILHVTHLVNHTATLLEAAEILGIKTVATLTDFFGICLNSKLEAVDGSLCAGPNAQRTNCFGCYLKGGVLRERVGLQERTIRKWATLIRACCLGFGFSYRLPVIRNFRISAHMKSVKERPNVLSRQYGSCRAIVAPTNFLKSAYENNGFSSFPMHRMSFGVDMDRKPKQQPIREAPIRFGFIGQIAPHKGTGILVEAFCRLRTGSSELHIYGAEGQFREYSQTLREMSSGHQVHFRGTFPSDKMRSILDELDFLVIPSTWYENSPLVLLNSLASHTPVIVSDVEGLTEFVEHGKNGFVFARGSVRELEEVMSVIVENPERSRRLSLTTEYEKTALAMAEEVELIYKSVVSK